MPHSGKICLNAIVSRLLNGNPVVEAWIVSALLSHSVDDTFWRSVDRIPALDENVYMVPFVLPLILNIDSLYMDPLFIVGPVLTTHR